MSRELQLQLKAGDQIIATEKAYYDYNETIKVQKEVSQLPGDLMMVNNTRVTYNSDGTVHATASIVSGTGLNREARVPGERPNLGLGTSLKVGTFRRATPMDPGYLMTRGEWDVWKDKIIAGYKLETMGLWVLVGILTTIVLINGLSP